MKIKNISCTQFAGIRDRSVAFADGLNVICGKNESGKSTLVNLLSRTLFQNAKLDRRSDKAFFEAYFPGAKKDGGIAGDFADGKITLETETGTYTLSKEWGADARCTLSTPDGILRDQSTIDRVLKELLVYGEGVYTDMLFSSQRNTDAALQTILDASKKTDAKQELADAVSQAFAESDGLSVDSIEQAIAAKIEQIAGKHWDHERKAPVRKAGRWSTGLGEILKDYYALEDARTALDEIEQLEREVDRTAGIYLHSDTAVCKAEEECSRFGAFASRLAVQSERKKTIARLEAELQKITEVLSRWPVLLQKLEKARLLKKEKSDRSVLDAWNYVQKVRAELSDDDHAAALLPQPEGAELLRVRKLQREIAQLENKLCGMNLNAAIRMLDGREIQIVSLRTGKPVELSANTAAITEAVKITVPGVMEMQLSPADVDVTAVESQIAQRKAAVAAVLEKYKTETPDALEAYAQRIEEARTKIEGVTARIARALGTVSTEQLEELYRNIGPAERTKEEIERDIPAVCGGMELAAFIARAEAVADGYAAEYGSINDLKAKAFDLNAELEKAKASVGDAADIPAEYRNIADPEAHLEALQSELKHLQALREAALTGKTAAASRLDTYKETHPEACRETVIKAETAFEETRSLLDHWLHIAEVFRAQKESIGENPMWDIAAHFARYLELISGGTVSSEFPEADKLNMRIYSANSLLDYGKLSEGTKDTVSLAFRLAVLDHLFPEGGGVIVLDDPFTDMDAQRTAQSCRLLRACAERHQVIFLTCKEEYPAMLEGNLIRF